MLSLAMHGCLLVVDHTAFTDCKMTMKWQEGRQYSSLFTHMVTLTKITNAVSADLGCSGILGFLDNPMQINITPPFFTKQTTTHYLPCCIVIGMYRQVSHDFCHMNFYSLVFVQKVGWSGPSNNVQ